MCTELQSEKPESVVTELQTGGLDEIRSQRVF